MRASVILFLIALGAFTAAFAAHQLLLPDVLPLADETDQAPWVLQAAFLLQAIENIAGIGAILVIVTSVVRRLTSRSQAASN